MASLQPGDLIFSTGTSWLSPAVRALTGGGPASHVALYVGTGLIIEAQPGQGVILKTVEDALKADVFAVAVRRPGLTQGEGASVVQYATQQLGKSFDLLGSVAQARVSFQGTSRRLDLGSLPDTFFCSTLVLEAYKLTRRPLVLLDPFFKTPNDIVPLTWFGDLEYVGHLKS